MIVCANCIHPHSSLSHPPTQPATLIRASKSNLPCVRGGWRVTQRSVDHDLITINDHGPAEASLQHVQAGPLLIVLHPRVDAETASFAVVVLWIGSESNR